MLKGKKTILCDVDGVLADFAGYLLQLADSSLEPKDINNWDMFSMMPPDERSRVMKILQTYEFWRTIPLLPHAQEAIEDLRRQGRVVFLTSPWANDTTGWQCKGWGHARSQWLREHFQAKNRHMIFTYSKWLVQGDLFVDDRFKNIKEWQQTNPNGKAYLMRKSHNRNDSWPRIVKIGEYAWEFEEEGVKHESIGSVI